MGSMGMKPLDLRLSSYFPYPLTRNGDQVVESSLLVFSAMRPASYTRRMIVRLSDGAA